MKTLLAALLLSTAAIAPVHAANIGVAMSNFDGNWLTVLRLAMQKSVEGKADVLEPPETRPS